MNAVYNELLVAFEIHSVDRIRAILKSGFDVRAKVDGKAPVNSLLDRRVPPLENIPNRYLRGA